MIREHTAQGEQVIVLLGKDKSMKPADMQCVADVGEGVRCEDARTYDPDMDHWSVFCADHLKAHKKVKAGKGPRVKRVVLEG